MKYLIIPLWKLFVVAVLFAYILVKDVLLYSVWNFEFPVLLYKEIYLKEKYHFSNTTIIEVSVIYPSRIHAYLGINGIISQKYLCGNLVF